VTDIPLAPRVENATSDTEPIAAGGFFQIRPALARSAGGQWVLPAWPDPVDLTGVAVTLKLDPVDTVPYELYAQIPSTPPPGSLRPQRYQEIHEFRYVKTTTPANTPWDQLEVASDPTGTGGTGGGTADGELAARVAALEDWRLTVGGDVTNVAQITGISTFAQTYLDDTSASATRATLGAAAVDGQTFTNASTSTTPASGDADTSLPNTAWVDTYFLKKADPTATGTASFVTVTVSGAFTVSGAVSLPAGSLAVSDVAGLQAELDSKVSSTVPDGTFTIAKTTGLQFALDGKLDDAQRGAPNGVAPLDVAGNVVNAAGQTLTTFADVDGRISDFVEANPVPADIQNQLDQKASKAELADTPHVRVYGAGPWPTVRPWTDSRPAWWLGGPAAPPAGVMSNALGDIWWGTPA
jgi:hypothetical protein